MNKEQQINFLLLQLRDCIASKEICQATLAALLKKEHYNGAKEIHEANTDLQTDIDSLIEQLKKFN